MVLYDPIQQFDKFQQCDVQFGENYMLSFLRNENFSAK